MKATRSQTIRFVIICLGSLVFGVAQLYQVWRAVNEGAVFDVYLEDAPIEFYFAAIACALLGILITKWSADGLRLVLQDRHHQRTLEALRQLEDSNGGAPSGLWPLWIALCLFAVFFVVVVM